MEKQTPKQRVLAVYPKAVAIKLDAKTVMSFPTWAVLEENDENARTLGENGSANGAWKNAATNLDNEEFERARRGVEVPDPESDVMEQQAAWGKTADLSIMETHQGDAATFGPNDYIENVRMVIGVDLALPGSEKTLLTRLDARDPAFLRAMGRVNGMSKLQSDSGTGKRLKPGVTRQQERNENTHRTRFRGLNTPQAHSLPNANPFYPPRKRNVFSPGVLKALAPFGAPKSNYANQLRSLVTAKGYSVGMK